MPEKLKHSQRREVDLRSALKPLLYLPHFAEVPLGSSSVKKKKKPISGVRGSGDGSVQSDPQNSVASAGAQRKRRIASIFQHYYPEGDWGYVILVCAFLVQVFSHGLQMSYGVLAMAIARRWRMPREEWIHIGRIEYLEICSITFFSTSSKSLKLRTCTIYAPNTFSTIPKFQLTNWNK